MSTKAYNKYSELEIKSEEIIGWHLARVKFIVQFIIDLIRVQSVFYAHIGQSFQEKGTIQSEKMTLKFEKYSSVFEK